MSGPSHIRVFFRKTWEFPWSRLVMATVFVGLPMLFVLFMLHFLLDLHREEFRESQRRELVGRLWEMSDEARPQRFLSRIGRDLHKVLKATGYSADVITRSCKEVSSKSGLSLNVFVFDTSGKLIKTPTYKEENRTFIQDLWQFHRTRKGGFYELYRNKIKLYFGQYFSFRYWARQPGHAMRIHGQNGNGLAFWEPGPAGKLDGIIILLEDTPPLSHFLGYCGNLISRSGVSIWVTGTDGVEKLVQQPRGFLSSAPETTMNTELGRAGLQSDETIRRIVLDETLQMQNTRVRARQVVIWKPAVIKTQFLNAFFILLVPFLIGGAVWYGGRIETVFFSIRTKLFFLFLYLTLIATLGFAALGLRQSLDRGEVALAESAKAAQDVLSGIDSEFTSAKHEYLEYFRSLRDSPDLQSGRFQQFLKRVGTDTVNWLEIRDMHGEIYFSPQRIEAFGDIGFINRCNAKRNIERYLADRMDPGQSMTYSPPEVIVQSVSESPVSGWLRIFESPNELHEVKFGQYDQLLFWDVYRGKSFPGAVFMVNQHLHVIAWKYLMKKLKGRFAHGRTAVRVVAWRSDYRQFQPAGFRAWPGFSRLIQRVDFGQETLVDRLYHNGEEMLVVVMPGKQLKGIVVAALFPLNEIRESIAAYRGNMILTVFSSIFLALLIGWLLSRAFLRPIAELDRGVQALHNRDPEVRLEILGNDEFGELSHTFNQTIEEVGELLFASGIQSQLIPSEPPVIPGYEMVLANLSATDLGGDYCDLVPLPDGRLFMLIGDVTGHGVSSALVMAMAKTAVFGFSRHPVPITEFMDDLNRLLLNCLGRKKLMTVYAGILEPKTGRVCYSNGGHPSTLLLRNDGSSEMLDLFHIPVGGYSSRRFPFEERETTMKEGDLLVLYTDGISELANPMGEFWGMDGFLAFLRGHAHFSLLMIKEKLLENLRQFSGTSRFEDDVTFILIRRKTGTEEENCDWKKRAVDALSQC